MPSEITETDAREWPVLHHVSADPIVGCNGSPLTTTWPPTTCKQVRVTSYNRYFLSRADFMLLVARINSWDYTGPSASSVRDQGPGSFSCPPTHPSVWTLNLLDGDLRNSTVAGRLSMFATRGRFPWKARTGKLYIQLPKSLQGKKIKWYSPQQAAEAYRVVRC
jgi:hypothetical protein